jgi:hypothetical protein
MSRARSIRAPIFAAVLATVFAGACSDRNESASRASGPPAAKNAAARQAPSGPGRFANVANPISPQLTRTDFRPYHLIDKTQGGLVVSTSAVPAGWNAVSNVEWKYSDASWPVRISARFTAPDGSAWVEWFSAECFYWLDPRNTSVPVGGRSLGMIHKPGVTIQDAMRYVLGRYRGQAQNLQILGFRPIPNLAQAHGQQNVAGESVALRARYNYNGHTIDEEFYCMLTTGNRIPYHGPQGTTYEMHRVLGYVHSLGATDGKLDSVHPLLGFIASSARADPVWQRHYDEVQNQINQQFNANLARGYAQIAAAGALSRQISANNDSMIRSMDAQRAATNRSMDRVNDNFSQYMRGTERVQDPYWGTSEQSYTNKYHWTDGQGNYQHSNDAGFNPNIGSNQNWQIMQPVK